MHNSSILSLLKPIKKSKVQSKKIIQEKQNIQQELEIKKKFKISLDFDETTKDTKCEEVLISKKTQELIDKIKKKKEEEQIIKNESERTRDLRAQLLAKIKNPQQKETIKKGFFNENDFPLEIKNLIEALKEIDQVINLFNITEKIPLLNEILETVNKTVSQNISQTEILKINFLCPKFYQFKWVISKKKEFKLLIQIKQKKNSPFLLKKTAEERLKKFKIKCKEFLISSKSDSIPLGVFPEKPNSVKAKRVTELIAQINDKQQEGENNKTSQILNELRVKGLIRKSDKLKEPLTNKEKVDQLRLKLLARVSKKEQELQDNDQDRKEGILRSSQLTFKIADKIFWHFKMREVENMFLVSIVGHLKKNISNVSLSELNDQIKILLSKCPDWIFEVKNEKGRILRINKNVTLEEIKKLLKQFKYIIQMTKLDDFKEMISSDFFTIEMNLEYMYKHRENQEMIRLLVDRLRVYEQNDVLNYIIEIVFFTFLFPSKFIDIFLLDLCSQHFENYLMITYTIEVWGLQFMQQSPEQKRRIRNMMEDCETAMVNGEKSQIKVNVNEEDQQKQLYNFVIGKRSINDFKDDVRSFLNSLVKLGYVLFQNKLNPDITHIAKQHLTKLNLSLHKRRGLHLDTIQKYRYMYQGIQLGFSKNSQSNLVVRVDHHETQIFQTNKRCPFLMYIETIDPKELDSKEPKWENDLDYLKYELKITDDQVKEKVKCTPGQKNEFKNYLKEQKEIFHSKFQQDIQLKKKRVKAHSCPQKGKRRQKKKKGQFYDQEALIKKLSKLSIPEIKSRMNFMMLLIKHSSSKGLNKMHVEFLEKLKGILQVLESKKNSKLYITQSTYQQREQRMRAQSPFGHFDSYQLRGYIVKYGDDMKQEKLMNHFVETIHRILKRENSQIYLRQLDFFVLSEKAAMIEFVEDSISISSIKKIHTGKNLREIYETKFSNNFEEAQRNFVVSLAGYSFVSYILQMRDRHNENILIDNEGYFVHIDFGYCLTMAPLYIRLEYTPFKFTQEYLDLLGGYDSPMYYYFKTHLIKAFEIFNKYSDEFWNLITMMKDAQIPCFQGFDLDVFKSRFHRFYTDKQREELVDSLIQSSVNSKTFSLYESFQKFSNGIAY